MTTTTIYDAAHRKRRDSFRSLVQSGTCRCWRCGKLIPPDVAGQRTGWHLGHDDFDPSIPAQPEHWQCNLEAAGKIRVKPSAPGVTPTATAPAGNWGNHSPDFAPDQCVSSSTGCQASQEWLDDDAHCTAAEYRIRNNLVTRATPVPEPVRTEPQRPIAIAVARAKIATHDDDAVWRRLLGGYPSDQWLGMLTRRGATAAQAEEIIERLS